GHVRSARGLLSLPPAPRRGVQQGTFADDSAMMDPTTLEGLLAHAEARTTPHGLSVVIPPAWVVATESRLSYATLIRLAECCREHHWRRDIVPRAPHLDSIVVRCEAEFRSPVVVGAHLMIDYQVVRVGARSYDCSFAFRSASSSEPHGRVRITSVFYD